MLRGWRVRSYFRLFLKILTLRLVFPPDHIQVTGKWGKSSTNLNLVGKIKRKIVLASTAGSAFMIFRTTEKLLERTSARPKTRH